MTKIIGSRPDKWLVQRPSYISEKSSTIMAKKQSLVEGTKLGAYQVVRLIGFGGMGEVYEAYEHNLHRRVALKIISPDQAEAHGRNEMVRRFLQEARTLAQVNHPNVVTIYTIQSIGQINYIAMEYVDGVSLKQVLRHFALTSDQAIAVFLQIFEGLRVLHQNRILHRDMKPHNLVLRVDGQIKILDFGIAKRVDDFSEETRAGVIVGSVPYMAPEIRAGQPATVRSDLWSAGAMLFECLTGEPLVKSMPAFGKEARNDKSDIVVFPKDIVGNIPEGMQSLVRRLCARDPNDRFASSTQAIEAFKMFQNSRPALPAETLSKMSKKVKALSGVSSKEPLYLDDAIIKTRERKPERLKLQKNSWFSWKISSLLLTLVSGLVLFTAAKNLSPLVQKALFSSIPWRPKAVERPGQIQDLKQENLRLLSPTDGESLWLEENQIATFSWSEALIAGKFELQIASDTNFSELVFGEPVDGRSFRPDRVLPEGTYYWRLIEQKGEKSVAIRSFTISYTSALELLQPKSGQVVPLSIGQIDAPMDFVWRCKPGAMNYKTQIARDSSFLEGVQEHISQTCFVRNIRLPSGLYYWRTRVENPSSALKVWSSTLPLIVRSKGSKEKDFELLEPKLVVAEQSEVLKFAPGKNQALKSPKLAWKPLSGAKLYVVQLSPRPNFSDVIAEARVRGEIFEWKDAFPGRMYWRVYAINSRDVRSNFSSTGQIDIQLPAPILKARYRLSEKDQEYNLIWRGVPLAKQYLVQWSASPEMKNRSQKVVRKPEVKINLEAGKPYVRVAVAAESGRPVSDFSRVAQIVKLSKPENLPQLRRPTTVELAAPAPITPISGAYVDSRNRNISVVFSWTEVSDSIGYTVELSSDSEFRKILHKKTVARSKWVFKNASLKGKIYWRVRVEMADGLIGKWSATTFFSVK